MRSLLLLLGLALSQNSMAYLSINESGELSPAGTYQVGFEPQFLLNRGGGVLVGFFLDQGVREDLSLRYNLGFGRVDFNIGTSAKWVPFPDYQRQPAIGVKGGLHFGRFEGENLLTVQIAPLLSKQVALDEERGVLIPYVAVPFNFHSGKGFGSTAIQFVVGSEFLRPDSTKFIFGAELALDFGGGFSMLNAKASWPFDSSTGLFGGK
ncbi:MAG: hypothetical protein N2578_01615 [Bdellovibrionaceae bacterium]|nr:hypothetical protein [Pseudobdellovibrionaceae bacterium]